MNNAGYIDFLIKSQCEKIEKTLFNAFGAGRIPVYIRCYKCGGSGEEYQKEHMFDTKKCTHCNGRGIPPIPAYEIFGSSFVFKEKKFQDKIQISGKISSFNGA